MGDRGGPSCADDAFGRDVAESVDEDRGERHVEEKAEDGCCADEFRAGASREITAQHGGERGEVAVDEQYLEVGGFGGEDGGIGVEDAEKSEPEGRGQGKERNGDEREQDGAREDRVRRRFVTRAMPLRDHRAGVAEGVDEKGRERHRQHRARQRRVQGDRRMAREEELRDERVHGEGELREDERQGRADDGGEGWIHRCCFRQSRMLMPMRFLKRRSR